MPVFKRPLSFLNRNTQKASGFTPNPTSSVLQPPASAPQQPKTLAQLEQEMAAEAQVLPTRPMRHSPNPIGRTFNKIKWTVILLGIPAGMVWFVNLPYPMIRRPVAEAAPILLLPSYISMDNHYRQAIASVEQAEQLINNPTSPADIDLGEQKVEQAQKSLNALPIGFLNDFPEYRYWWYDWRFSSSRFYDARTTVAQLEAVVFQEKNAQVALFDAEQALNTAKQQYQQATTSVDKGVAIAAWQSALDQLAVIPSQTLAGRTAQQKYVAAERDFAAIVGVAAGNERTSAMIEAARGFAWEAAKAGQNPPHSVEQWLQVEALWQQAIQGLEQVPNDDLVGYAEAQRLLAEYNANLGQIRVRQENERISVAALQRAKDQIAWVNNYVDGDIGYIASELQSIINDLEKVEEGTTAYLEAQELLLLANNKLNQLQPQ
ncbi:hypothetical protein H6F93_27955 [Leptolyngbya sp. FACHB-671]|uniref:hypothetical protein n=1 Tax=Leptolyngbya sp. FACHB-671 TaxID=2692812 RepID=UPI00168A073F|nr:hypothetical protein [Leptolyngbya sp. FACHB-671]MBD2071305.1 hypothetical protein [Leptolyngbya sp. FACHB-671]